MYLTFRAPMDIDRSLQVAPPPGKTLGDLCAPHQAHVTGCLVNGVFVDDWATYRPTQDDRIIVFVETGWGELLVFAIYAVVSAVISLAISYALKALTPDPPKPDTAGKPEQIFGVAGTLGGRLAVPPAAEALVVGGERVPVPPGLAALVQEVQGLPFRLGARNPHAAQGLDCLGLTAWLLHRGLGLDILDPHNPYDIVLTPALLPVWLSPPDRDDASWVTLVQPWDLLIWRDPAADAALAGTGPADRTWLHTAVAINQAMLVSMTIDQGTLLHSAQRTADVYGAAVLALLRPTGISAWEPARIVVPGVNGLGR